MNIKKFYTKGMLNRIPGKWGEMPGSTIISYYISFSSGNFHEMCLTIFNLYDEAWTFQFPHWPSSNQWRRLQPCKIMYTDSLHVNTAKLSPSMLIYKRIINPKILHLPIIFGLLSVYGRTTFTTQANKGYHLKVLIK